MFILFNAKGNPTTLQADDVVSFDLDQPTIAISRETEPLHFGLFEHDLRDNKKILTGLPLNENSFRDVVELIAAVTGLSFKPLIRVNRNIQFAMAKR
jgi:hypothetical protein